MERRYVFHYRYSVKKNCFSKQNFTEIGQSAAELWQKQLLKRQTAVTLDFKNAHIWSSDTHRDMTI